MILGALSLWHLVIVAVLVVVLFGRGKISELMGDVAKGIKSFRKGMADEEAKPDAKQIPGTPATPVEPAKDETRAG